MIGCTARSFPLGNERLIKVVLKTEDLIEAHKLYLIPCSLEN